MLNPRWAAEKEIIELKDIEKIFARGPRVLKTLAGP